MRALLYALASLVAMLFYGGQVCPFLEGLTLLETAIPLGVGLILAAVARGPLLARLVFTRPELEQSRARFQVELGLYLVVGLGLAVFNTAYHHFPAESGAKLVLGCATFGFFFGLSLALEQEHALIVRLSQGPRAQRLLPQQEAALARASSLTRRVGLVAGATIGLVTLDVLLVILKDLSWIVMMPPEGLAVARSAVMVEIIFIMALLLALVLLIIHGYMRNLQLLFENETSVLEGVAKGNLDRYVAVATADEFGKIARHTNHMIDELRERGRIKQIFGKLVSPSIAQRLLAGAESLPLGHGRRRQVVILFSDVRNFTMRAEASAPEQVVQDLNCYFEKMVNIVHSHGGVVDKFIGDGMMVIFGLDEAGSTQRQAATHAAQAGLDMLRGVEALQRSLSSPLEIGVGIHQGEVIEGLIGATERLEYTFIGDAVNVAARIEGATRALGAALLISDVVKNGLSGAAAQWPWHNYGAQPLKGKQQEVQLFGLLPGQWLGEQVRQISEVGRG